MQEMKDASLTIEDGIVRIETTSVSCSYSIVTLEEERAAMEMWLETGCVPEDYAAKIASGRLWFKAPRD
jgi:hypothetical protein